jgi:hypothetical protein
VDNLLDARRILMTAQAPMIDPSRLSVMVSPTIEQQLLNTTNLAQWQGAGPTGEATQVTGALGQRFGFGRIFANQNVSAHTAGTYSGLTSPVCTATAGATSVTITGGGSGSGTLKAGDIVTIGGRTYAVTADVTGGAAAITVSISPALEVSVTGAVCSFNTTTVIAENLAYHRDAFGLAMARLPDFSNTGLFGTAALGAQVASVQDPVTGLAVRSRIYYVGNSSEVHVALDVLYGWKCLNPRLATRLRDAS